MRITIIPSNTVNSIEETLWYPFAQNRSIRVQIHNPPPEMQHGAPLHKVSIQHLEKSVKDICLSRPDFVVVECAVGFLWYIAIRHYSPETQIAIIPHYNPVVGYDLTLMFLAACVRQPGDIVLAGSESARGGFEMFGFEVEPIFPIGVDTRFFNAHGTLPGARKNLGLDPHSLYCVYAGRLDCDKRVLELISSFADIYKEIGAILLVCYKDGAAEYRQQCLQEIRRNSFAIDIFSPTRSNLRDIYTASNLYVTQALSYNETFGRAPLEALSCGTPVVAPNFNGFRDNLSERSSVLIPVSLRNDNWDLSSTRFNSTIVELLSQRRKLEELGSFAIANAVPYALTSTLSEFVRLLERQRHKIRQVDAINYGIELHSFHVSVQNLFADFEGESVLGILEYSNAHGPLVAPIGTAGYRTFWNEWFRSFI